MSDLLSCSLETHQTYEYTTFETPVRPNFKLKEGWEYILTTIGYKYHNVGRSTALIQTVKEILQSSENQNPLLTSCGGGRDVYSLPDTAHTSPHKHIVKFPKATDRDDDLDGVTQNWQEAHIWGSVDTPDEQHKLVPTAATHEFNMWNIMPQGEIYTEASVTRDEIDEFLDHVYEEIGQIGDVGQKIGPSEYKPHNVVVIDGEMYMCDYGYSN